MRGILVIEILDLIDRMGGTCSFFSQHSPNILFLGLLFLFLFYYILYTVIEYILEYIIYTVNFLNLIETRIFRPNIIEDIAEVCAIIMYQITK